MTFSFINSLIAAGYDHPLEEEELPELPEQNKAELHGLMLEDAWKTRVDEASKLPAAGAEAESDAGEKHHKALLDRALISAMFSVYGKAFAHGGAWKLPHDVLAFAAPYLVKAIYAYVDPKSEWVANGTPSWQRGLGLCFILFAVQFAGSVALHQYFDKMFDVSLRMRAALVTCIYRKSLRLSHSSRQYKSLGELVNLMSVDVQRLTDLVPYLHNLLWSSPLQILLAMYLLFRLVGVASLVGFGVMIAVIPVNASILLKLRKLQEANMKEKDKRVKTVSEVLHSMKVIKMFAWERPLSNQIRSTREVEVQRLRRYGYISSLQSIFWNSAPVTVSVATFGAYTALGNRLDMQIVLPALAIINIMSFPLFVFPLLISAVISGKVALGRLNEYMNLPERDTSHIIKTDDSSLTPIALEGCALGWNASRPILDDVNIKIPKGSLTVVVGPVGSGKSSLLAAILGDAKAYQGLIHAPEEVAYVPQQAWIQNNNVRENILFGQPFDQEKYDKVVKACSLTTDFEKFAAGDKTEIGERGVNLSGGQKQRIGLARAVYQDKGVILLDDVLSALDSHVGEHVLHECITGILDGKTRLLVTHKLDVLPSADWIIVLRDGGIQAQGTLADLQAKGVNFGDVCDEEDDKSETYDENPSESVARTESNRAHGNKEGENQEEEGANPEEGAEAVRKQDSAEAEEGEKKGEEPKKEEESATTSTKGVVEKEEKEEVVAKTAGGEDKDGAVKKDDENKEGQAASTSPQPKRSKSHWRQVTQEGRAQGAVSTEVYMTYLRELQWPMLCVMGVVGALSQAARNGNDWWLTRWASASDRERVGFYLGVYAAWNVGSAILFLVRDVGLMLTELRAASSMHNRMLRCIMRAPMSFFDATPIGRILNRFSNDQDSLDLTLPRTLNQLYSCMLRVGGTIFMVCVVSPTFLIAMIPVAALYWTAQQYYSKTSRELKRIESTTKSPLYAHFGESISGSSCIRAVKQEKRFCAENARKIDMVNNLFALMNDCNRWLAVRLELCGNGIVTGAALTGVISRRLGVLSVDRARLVGLSLTLALSVTNSLGWMVRMSTESEAQMNSVERVSEYSRIKSEEKWLKEALSGAGAMEAEEVEIPDDQEWSKEHKWPTAGEVKLEGYSFTYHPDLPNVLDNISITIKAGEKVGVCGRTGAGKSSLLLALYRMGLASGGRIVIDGQDIAEVPLEQLRGGLAIVPQEPMLFQGSVVYNLDPFGEFSEEAVWAALAKVQLDDYIKSLPEGLHNPVGEGGSNLSVGQRQLLCMARALLKDTKLLVLDEATAAVDEETDRAIQRAVREACVGCTVITIAHRLNTILDYDKVLLLKQGKVQEFDSPSKLAKDPDSEFYSMLSATRLRRSSSRATSVQNLEKLAKDAPTSSPEGQTTQA